MKQATFKNLWLQYYLLLKIKECFHEAKYCTTIFQALSTTFILLQYYNMLPTVVQRLWFSTFSFLFCKLSEINTEFARRRQVVRVPPALATPVTLRTSAARPYCRHTSRCYLLEPSFRERPRTGYSGCCLQCELTRGQGSSAMLYQSITLISADEAIGFNSRYSYIIYVISYTFTICVLFIELYLYTPWKILFVSRKQ